MLPAALLSLLAATPLDSGWSYRWGDLQVIDGQVTLPAEGWKPMAVGTVPSESAGERTVWVRITLPALLPREGVVVFESVIGHFEVYLAGRRVLSFPQPGGVEANGMHGLPWHLVALPEDAAGRELALRVRSAYPMVGFQAAPSLTSRAEFFETVVREDTPRFVVGALMVVLAALGVLVLARDRRSLAVGFVGYALAAGLYVLYYTRLKQLTLPLTPPLWFFLWVVSLAVMPATYQRLLGHLFETPTPWFDRFRRMHERLGGALVLLCLGLWAALWLVPAPAATSAVVLVFFAATTLQRLTLLASSLWSTVLLVQFARGRGVASDVSRAKVLLAGIAVLFVGTWLNVAASLGVGGSARGAWVPLGLLAMTVALAVLLERAWRESGERALASERALLERAREKEALLRDLHDGIGSVTTNIRMLAELGQRDGHRAGQSLATIAELSSEGIAELRAFTQSLDESQVGWPVLASELRRFGGQLIESQGLGFTLETRVAEDAAPPSGSVTLALLRIFREALTNVVKHSGAKQVEAVLVVSPGRLTFELRDDGAGGGSGGGLDTGRGLRNMQARARELGGTVELRVGAGTTLWLELPLTGSGARERLG